MVREAIQNLNSMAALPSVRKGEAQHLAKNRVPADQITRLTDHDRMGALRPHLGYGHQLTAAAELARANAANALYHERSSSAPTRRHQRNLVLKNQHLFREIQLLQGVKTPADPPPAALPVATSPETCPIARFRDRTENEHPNPPLPTNSSARSLLPWPGHARAPTHLAHRQTKTADATRDRHTRRRSQYPLFPRSCRSAQSASCSHTARARTERKTKIGCGASSQRSHTKIRAATSRLPCATRASAIAESTQVPTSNRL